MPRKKSTSTQKSQYPSQRAQASTRAAKLREELFSRDLSVSELAHVLDRSPAAIAGYLRDGTIQGYRTGRSWRISEEAVRQYVARLRGVPTPPPTLWTYPSTTTTAAPYSLTTHPVSSYASAAGSNDAIDQTK